MRHVPAWFSAAICYMFDAKCCATSLYANVSGVTVSSLPIQTTKKKEFSQAE